MHMFHILNMWIYNQYFIFSYITFLLQNAIYPKPMQAGSLSYKTFSKVGMLLGSDALL